MQIRDVEGYCPMGCGRTLHLMQSGIIKCLSRDCPDPIAVHKILSDPETAHVVDLGESAWGAKHPLRERIGDQLLDCRIGDAAEQAHAFGQESGRYRVTRSDIPGGEAWRWELLGGKHAEDHQADEA